MHLSLCVISYPPQRWCEVMTFGLKNERVLVAVRSSAQYNPLVHIVAHAKKAGGAKNAPHCVTAQREWIRIVFCCHSHETRRATKALKDAAAARGCPVPHKPPLRVRTSVAHTLKYTHPSYTEILKYFISYHNLSRILISNFDSDFLTWNSVQTVMQIVSAKQHLWYFCDFLVQWWRNIA